MTAGDVGYDVVDGIATLTLDRPEAHNALTVHMVRRFAEASAAAQADDDVRVVVVTGAGDKAFCAGGDLGELIPRLTTGELEILTPDPTKRFLSDVDKPVVAAVNGLCVAGGLELLLGTDIRVAANGAVFGLPEVRWGLVPGGGSHVRLPQQVPWAFAMQLLLSGDHVGAERAREAGLVNEVLPRADVLPRAQAIAAGIARNAPLAVRAAKEIAVRALANEPRFALEYALNARVVASEDAREGPRAFTEKRTPKFVGR
ncbi:enoyl-CoA hydratase-related protein [Pseudonocardia sp. RS11V-5]|uniref:enoyl-CoA hydratase/isomerase family protein n=1 Tax=Pseudonocardia terrae TaxID=2905831 RepID=UPI001E2F9A47|nr:enoyl-CoA hydratase-related protein [Pseudonocardia terrae]MCE3551150.1 enoyl-CoA hydratase-related protein [Pseudonocardia terrae]